MNSSLVKRISTFLSKPFFHERRTIFWLWLLLSLIAMVFKIHRTDNNFLIFKGVFWHTLHQISLYTHYPGEYTDVNHYGPVFSLVIAPFALMPHWLGMLLWLVALSMSLFYAIRYSGMEQRKQMFIYWFCSQTLLTSLFMQQFNVAIAAIIIGSYFLIEKEHDFWAAFLIVLGTFIKLYGVVGLAFFFFSRHKIKFTFSLLIWSAILFVAPMAISSPEYIIGQYKAWYFCLLEKNGENIHSIAQNISALGMFRRISGNMEYSDMYFIAPALLLFFIPYLRIHQYKNAAFRQTIMASTLLFVVLFSTGSESGSYIIALSGACMWYLSAPWKRNRWDVALMIFAFVLSGLSSSDIFPRSFKHAVIQHYSLKALPCLIIWLKLCYEMTIKNYGVSELTDKSPEDAYTREAV